MLWNRTGAQIAAFDLKRTHEESMDFVGRHLRLLEAVKHVTEENGKDKLIARYLHPGYAAALLYLMATGRTERERDGGDGYAEVDNPDESQLDFSLWDRAEEYWRLIAQGDPKVLAIRAGIAATVDMDEGAGGTLPERMAVLILGWQQFVDGNMLTPDKLQLKYVRGEDGGRTLAEKPVIGGIDLGDTQ
jgi:hypothetical protein